MPYIVYDKRPISPWWEKQMVDYLLLFWATEPDSTAREAKPALELYTAIFKDMPLEYSKSKTVDDRGSIGNALDYAFPYFEFLRVLDHAVGEGFLIEEDVSAKLEAADGDGKKINEIANDQKYWLTHKGKMHVSSWLKRKKIRFLFWRLFVIRKIYNFFYFWRHLTIKQLIKTLLTSMTIFGFIAWFLGIPPFVSPFG